MKTQFTAEEVLQKLKEGNARFLQSRYNPGDVSSEIRRETYAHGQHPYATIVACSDSREIPEAIFSCGIGEIFTVRVAGNVIGETQLGSVEYAAEHLGVPLTVILGHTNCGAVGAALEGHTGGHVGVITKDIQKAVKGILDPSAASRRNALCQAERIRKAMPEHKVASALYHIEDGTIEWLD